jgi:hypothetical protein
MSSRLHHQLPLHLDTPYWCHDCTVAVPLAVAPAGDHGFYLGYICPLCQVAADILGVLATRELAQALLGSLDPSQQAIPGTVRHDR